MEAPCAARGRARNGHVDRCLCAIALLEAPEKEVDSDEEGRSSQLAAQAIMALCAFLRFRGSSASGPREEAREQEPEQLRSPSGRARPGPCGPATPPQRFLSFLRGEASGSRASSAGRAPPSQEEKNEEAPRVCD